MAFHGAGWGWSPRREAAGPTHLPPGGQHVSGLPAALTHLCLQFQLSILLGPHPITPSFPHVCELHLAEQLGCPEDKEENREQGVAQHSTSRAAVCRQAVIRCAVKTAFPAPLTGSSDCSKPHGFLYWRTSQSLYDSNVQSERALGGSVSQTYWTPGNT